MRVSTWAVRALIVSAIFIPGAISASPAGPSVRVDSCRVDAGRPAQSWQAGYGTYAPYGYYGPNRGYVRSSYPYRGGSYYEPATAPSLSIGYANTAAQPATSIDFGLVAKGHTVAVVRDVGTFSTNAKIEHVFTLSPNVFPLGTDVLHCVPLHIAYSDGTAWSRPAGSPH
jgi:hypothetical protein